LRMQVSLTVSECKRLIGKGVAKMDIVRQAYKNGTILLSGGTTDAYVFEELTGVKVDKELSMCGFIVPFGACRNHVRGPETMIIRGTKILREDAPLFSSYIDKMRHTDVYIKGANALDMAGKAAVMFGHPSGGAQGPIIRKVIAKGMNFIVPVGLEKLIPIPLAAALEECRTAKVDYSMGMPVRLMEMKGRVVTELDAVRILSGAEAIPIGKGGIGGAEGALTMIIKGGREQVATAREMIKECKGELPIRGKRMDCKVCPVIWCPDNITAGRRPSSKRF